MAKKCLLLAVAVFMILCATAWAQEETLVYGDFEYTINEDGTVTVSKWLKKSGVAMVPETVDGHQVVAIGDDAFSYCFDLTEISLPEGIVSVGESALAGSFSSIKIPASVKDIGTNAFEGCVALTRVEVAPENTAYAAVDGVLFSKEDKRLVYYPRCRENAVYEVPVGTTAIDAYAFANNKLVKEVILPEGVETIGLFAFHYCSELSNITLSEGLTTLDDYVFDDCSKLEKLYLPSTLTQLGIAFTDNPVLTTIEVSDQNPLFEAVNGLLFNKEERQLVRCPEAMVATSVVIPEGTLSIGRGAFMDCKAIMSITFPESLKTIEENAFRECGALQEIIIPAGVESIDFGGFYGCNNLKTVVLPENLKTIGGNAFYRCPIEELVLPDSLESIGGSAFCATKMSEITIPGSVPVINAKTFESGVNLTTVNIEHGVESIGELAFFYCENLTQITIPASVSSIGKRVFEKCPLVTVTLVEGSAAEQYCIENEVPFVYMQ